MAVRQPRDQPPDAAEAFAEAAFRRHGFQQDAAVDQLERDVDEVGVVGQADGIGAANPGRSAELREKVAQVVKSLGMDNLPSGSSIKVT